MMKLLFDAPLKGESKYGKYFAYAVDVNGEEMTFFSPNDEVNHKLISLKRGSKIQITKTAKQNGKGIVVSYDVEILEEKKTVSVPESTANDLKEDFYYSMMEKAFESALRIQGKFNGMANVNQLAVTIYISMLKQNNSFTGG